MADGHHIENRFWPQLSSQLSDFSEIWRGKQFFTEFGTDACIPQNVFVVL